MRTATKCLHSRIATFASGADAPRVLWRALVGLYDDPFTYVRANVTWALLGVPLYAALFLALLPWLGGGPQPDATLEAAGADLLTLPVLAAGVGMLVVPSAGGPGLAALAARSARGETPEWADFAAGLRRYWRAGLALWAVGVAALALLLANVSFYLLVVDGWLKLLGILWLYATLFWLSMQTYLLPLRLHLDAARLLDLYRRAALLTLVYPAFSAGVALATLVVSVLAVVFLPLALLGGGAFLALVQAHAFRSVRLRLGDLAEEPVRNLDPGWPT